MNLVMLLEMAAEAFPERIAVASDDRALTYAQLLRAAHAAAQEFRASECAYVALLDESSLAVPIAIFGAAFAGIPYVPLNYRLTKPELEELLQRVAPAYLIGNRVYIDALATPAKARVIEREAFIEQFLTTTVEPMVAEGAPEDIAIQLFTSGTTGKPKAALLRHENVMSYILGSVEFGGADEDDAILVTVPPYHIAGISAVLSSTYAARRMIQLPNFDAAEWLRLCREKNISNVFLVPTMLARIVDHLTASGEAPSLPALRAIAYGGGKMPLSVIERAMQLFPAVDFTNAYGLTETSSTICLLDPQAHRAAAASNDPAVRKRLTSVGKPLDTIELQIRGDNGEIAAPNQSGDVFVRGGQVAGEYLELGTLLDAEGWFPTRDRGYLDDEGYLFLEGRADDVIVRGGENISPGEIEDVLLAHPAVLDAAVVAIASEQWGEGVGAAIVLRENKSASAADLQTWVKQRLRSSRVPEHIVFKTQLPYNEMGKVLRRVIKQEFES